MASFITTSSDDPTYPLFPMCATIGTILILLPAYWQVKSGNVGTICYITWVFVGNLNSLVNSTAWNGNLHEPPWLWCDFSTAVMVALNLGLPTSSLLITRNLYSIASIQHVSLSDNERRRAKYVEIALGIGLPIFGVICRVVVQGHRFDIIESIGCWPAVYVTPVTVPMLYLQPIIINLISTVYAALSIKAFWKQRKQIREIMVPPNSGLTLDRYFRLMALAATEIICCLPCSTYLMINNLTTYGVHPWISWNDTHAHFNRFERWPFGWFRLHPESWVAVNMTRYSMPAASLLFFLYLGMSGEAGIVYRQQFRRLAVRLGFPDPSALLPHIPRLTRPPVIAASRHQKILPLNNPQRPPIPSSYPNFAFPTEDRQSYPFSGSLDVHLSMPSCFYELKELDVEMAYLLRPPPSAALRSRV